MRLGLRSWIRPAAAGEPADRSHRHVVVTEDLTREAYAAEPFRRQHVALGDGHLVGLAFDELDAAGGAAGVAAARMQLIDAGILLEREHQAFVVFYSNGWESFDRQNWHRLRS